MWLFSGHFFPGLPGSKGWGGKEQWRGQHHHQEHKTRNSKSQGKKAPGRVNTHTSPREQRGRTGVFTSAQGSQEQSSRHKRSCKAAPAGQAWHFLSWGIRTQNTAGWGSACAGRAGTQSQRAGVAWDWAPKSIMTRSQAEAGESPQLRATSRSGRWDQGLITQQCKGQDDRRRWQFNLQSVICSWSSDSDLYTCPKTGWGPQGRPCKNRKHGGQRARVTALSPPPHLQRRRSQIRHKSLPNCFLDTFTREKCFWKHKRNPKWGTIAGKGGETLETNFLDLSLWKYTHNDPPFS